MFNTQALLDQLEEVSINSRAIVQIGATAVRVSVEACG